MFISMNCLICSGQLCIRDGEGVSFALLYPLQLCCGEPVSGTDTIHASIFPNGTYFS
jgi:hypothetical protein